MQSIGSIKTIMRYPVKSMAGEKISSVFVSYAGLQGDRVFAFVDKNKEGNFPWFSARTFPNLILYKPTFTTPLDPSKQFPDLSKIKITVTTPSDQKLPIDSNTLLTELQEKSNKSLQLRFSEKSMCDSRPLSLISYSTIDALKAELNKSTLDPLRFRMSFYVDWNTNDPYFEDTLIGKTLKIGDKLEIQISKRDPRCRVIALDPSSAEQDLSILKHVAKEHQGCMGVYGVVLREGIVNENDIIHLKE